MSQPSETTRADNPEITEQEQESQHSPVNEPWIPPEEIGWIPA